MDSCPSAGRQPPPDLDGPTDPGAGAVWAAEIERRIAAIAAGTVKLEAWADVRTRIEREVLNR